MAEQPGFWSAENFPYMPLLALGQTIPRGYQYQSQMTPYRRDARGDWGRALNESIDQFFAMYPQWQQQKRAFALQREQLARQRLEDAHRAKLRPFELRQLKANEDLLQQKLKMRENYPQMVKGLKVSDEIKSYLLTQTPEQGNKFLQTYYAHQFKPKKQFLSADQTGLGKPAVVSPDGDIKLLNVPRELVTLKPGESLPGTKIVNNTQQDIQVDPYSFDIKASLGTAPTKKIVPLGKFDSRRGAFPEWQQPYLKLDMTQGGDGEVIVPDAVKTAPENLVDVPKNDPRLKHYAPDTIPFLKMNKNTGQIHEDPAYTKAMEEKALAKVAPSRSQLFQTKHSQNNYENIRAIGDLAEVAGQNFKAQSIAAVQLLPAGHPVRERAQYEIDKAGIKMGPNGVFEPEQFRPGPKGQKRSTASAPKSTLVNPGETLDQIVERFKKDGVTVNKSQVVAANKYFFPEGDENKMKHSGQVGNAEMLIPVGGGQLNESQVNAAHRSSDPRHNRTVIPGVGSYTNFNIATVGTAIKLNTDLADMKKLQSNVDELVAVMKRPEAIGLMKIGHPARGLIEGIRWRLINNVQRLRDFGVLTPGEIEVIEESVPNRNSFFNMVAGKLGLKPERFIEGALRALQAEGRTKANELRALMNQYQIKETSFDIYQYDPYANQGPVNQNQGSGQVSESQQFVDSFRQ